MKLIETYQNLFGLKTEQEKPTRNICVKCSTELTLKLQVWFEEGQKKSEESVKAQERKLKLSDERISESEKHEDHLIILVPTF